MTKRGDVFVFERRYAHGKTVQHRWEATVTAVTKRRVYFGALTWFAIDDPSREVRPRYLDYWTTAMPKRSTE